MYVHTRTHCISHQCQSNKLKHLKLESVVDHKVLPRRAPSLDMKSPSCKTNDGRYCCQGQRQGARLGWWLVGGGLNTLCVFIINTLSALLQWVSLSCRELKGCKHTTTHLHCSPWGLRCWWKHQDTSGDLSSGFSDTQRSHAKHRGPLMPLPLYTDGQWSLQLAARC